MEITTREVDHIQKDITVLHEKVNAAGNDIRAIEAVSEERHTHIILYLDALRNDLKDLTTSVRVLQEIASEGKTSLRTILWIGGLASAIITIALLIWDALPK